MKLILSLALMLLAGSAHAAATYLGTANQDVTVSTGTNTIGAALIRDGQGEVLEVNADGSINAAISGTVTANVNASTQTLRGRSGETITSEAVGANEALHVKALGVPDLEGKSLVYKSSDNFVVGGALTLTGLGKTVDLQALGNDCTFNLGGGDDINVSKNTAESFDLGYTITNPTVNLTAKGASATCKARLTGAN